MFRQKRFSTRQRKPSTTGPSRRVIYWCEGYRRVCRGGVPCVAPPRDDTFKICRAATRPPGRSSTETRRGCSVDGDRRLPGDCQAVSTSDRAEQDSRIGWEREGKVVAWLSCMDGDVSYPHCYLILSAGDCGLSVLHEEATFLG